MKSTDVIQPLPMRTPIAALAASGSRDNIPQAQADAQESWFCSIENGFPDITMQAQNLGGQPPRGQGANGLFYLSSDQRVFLQNGGIITFNQAVSDEIGGYPAGAVLDYISENTIYKVQSLKDDNTGNFVNNPALIDGVNWQILTQQKASPTQYGVVKPDGTTITAQNGIISAVGAGANTDLSNLTFDGNAKFQFAPFSINSGSVDASGNNNTLQAAGEAPSVITVEKNIIPALNSNNNDYCTVSGTGGSSAYLMTNANEHRWYSAYGGGSSGTWTLTLAANNHIPAGAECTFTMRGYSIYTRDVSLTFNYVDGTSEQVWTQASINTQITDTVSALKEVISIAVQAWSNGAASSQTLCELYFGGFTLNARWQETISSADTLICAPCTITTADGKTKTFNADNVLNINEKNYTVTGSPVISSDFIASGFKNAATNAITTPSITWGNNIKLLLKLNSGALANNGDIITRPSNNDYCIGLNLQSNGKFQYSLSSTGTSFDILSYENGSHVVNANSDVWVMLTYDGAAYKFYISTDGATFTEDKSVDYSSQLYNCVLNLGHTGSSGADTYNFAGSIDLKAFKIYVDGELEYSAVNQADGDYKILKSYEDGSLKLVNSLTVQKTPPASGLWLDNSRYPLMLKNFSVIGSPVISADGIASGFSNTSYLTTSDSINLGNSSWQFNCTINTSADVQTEQWFINSINNTTRNIAVINELNNNVPVIRVRCYVYNTDASRYDGIQAAFNSAPNTQYKISIKYDGNSVYTFMCNDESQTVTNSYKVSGVNKIIIGKRYPSDTSSFMAAGSIDLNAFKIYVDNKLIYEAISNDVYIGDASVSGGLITAVSNNPFNWNGITGSSAAMPSNRVINLTLGASGSTYTAPADGWFSFYAAKSTAGYTYLRNNTIGFQIESRTTVNDTGCGCYLPVKKGDVVTINYDGVNSNTLWRFYYAQGN